MLGPKPEDMYAPTRRAVEDALWRILGRVAYGVLLGILVLVGLQLVVLTLLFGDGSAVSLGLLVVGGTVVTGSLYELNNIFALREAIREQRR